MIPLPLPFTFINVSELKDMLIAKPEIKVQQRIVDISKSYSVKIEVERQYRNKIKLQKKGLMHDLLTAKVRVKADSPGEEKFL